MRKKAQRWFVSDLRPEARDEGYEDDIGVQTDEAIRKAGGDAIFVKCDVTKVDEVKALVEASVKKYGKLDIMVANAGVFTVMAKIHEKTEAQYDLTMNVNVKGGMECRPASNCPDAKAGQGGQDY